jgi:DNA polymerase III sliding clamp (beta) subunit (PCNA family)
MKEIELPVNELKTALAGFNKVLVRSSLPVLGCIRVQPQLEGVDLQATDLDTHVTFRINTTAPADFAPCLVSITALATVAKSAKERIWLVQEEPMRIKVRHMIGNHPVEQPIETLPIEEWPPIQQVKARPFVVQPEFKQCLRNAMECTSADSSRYVLNGVCLDVTKPDCHCMVATDGRHLFSANTFEFRLSESAIIPNRKFLAWAGFADDGDWLMAADPPVPDKEGKTQTPGWVQIQSERWTFRTKTIEGKFPNWRQVVPSPERACTTVKLSEQAVGVILDAIPRMPGADQTNQGIRVEVRSGRLYLQSRPRYTEDCFEIPVPDVTVNGADSWFCLNRTFITKALRFGFAEFHIQDELSPVLFVAPGRTFVAMVLRMDEAAPAQKDTEPATETSTEPDQPVNSPPEEPETKTDQNNMAQANNITTLPAPGRGNLKATNGHNSEATSAIKAVVDQVERLKSNLRQVLSDLNDTIDLLRAAEKEKKATLKEVESIRSTLRSLQKVEL